MQQFDQDQGTAEGRVVMDPRLEAVVDRMFERCLNDRRSELPEQDILLRYTDQDQSKIYPQS